MVMLEDTADLDPAEMRQFIRIIFDQVGSMRTLTGGLLDMARIETGTLPVDPEPVEEAGAGGPGQERLHQRPRQEPSRN